MNLSPLAHAIYEMYDGDFDDWIIYGDDKPENILWVDSPSGSIPDYTALQNRTNELFNDKPKHRVRRQRDKLLTKSDWVVVKYQELGKAVPAAWTTRYSNTGRIS